MNFGSRIADERKAAGYSQAALAQACGVSREMWGKYERDAAVPGGDVLARTAAAGLDVLYILTGERFQKRLKVASEGRQSPVKSDVSSLSKTDTKSVLAAAVSPPEPKMGDLARLKEAIAAVEEGLAETRRKLPPDKRAELIFAAYELMAEPEQSRANVIRLVRTAA